MTSALATDTPPVDSSTLAYARRWHRLGGGSAEDILLGFGLDVAQFSRRVLDLLDTTDLVAANLPISEADRIRRVYRARLWSVRR